MRKDKKIIFISCILIFALVLPMFNTGLADEEKEYREGELVTIGNFDYVFAPNTDSLEILKINQDNSLEQVGEIYLEGAIASTAHKEGGQSYLFVSTGSHIYKINVSNPYSPYIELDRYVYEWRRNRAKIGYVSSLAVNDNFLFVGSRNGVKAMGLNNLIVEKEYTPHPAFGLTADNGRLVAITDVGAMIFDVYSSEKLFEYNLKNKNQVRRSPAMDSAGNVYLPEDNSLVKINKRGDIVSRYLNPVEAGVVHSFGADVLNSDQVYYVNGFGLTSLNDDLKKQDFVFSASDYNYGSNSWALNLSAGQDKIVIFNRSSVLLFSSDLKFLSQYSYSPKNNAPAKKELGMNLSKYFGGVRESINVNLHGFWPNEEVSLEIGKKTFQTESNKATAKMNEFGFGSAVIGVPQSEVGVIVLRAVGVDSGLRYESTFRVQ